MQEKKEWLWLLDRLFEDGKALSALDRCIGTQIKEIGKPDFTHQIVLCLPGSSSRTKRLGRSGWRANGLFQTRGSGEGHPLVYR
ncbi:DUF4855 domain-containing protein [Bacteroides thetaiotaomicron]|nr:DUF4855 domain-containing protein [Bacteroides thetaiotaomicron]